MVTDDSTRFAKDDNLGVRGGVVAGEVAVPAFGDDLTVVDNDGSDRDFAGIERALRGAESGFHEELVRERTVVGRWSSVAGHKVWHAREITNSLDAFY